MYLNSKPTSGVYPGSGVAVGGQQGKRVGNGVTGAFRGGGVQTGASPVARPAAAVAAASRPSPTQQANKAQAISSQYAHPDPYRSVIRNGKRVLVRLSQLTPAEKASFAARAPGATATPGTATDPAGAATTPVAETPALATPDFSSYLDGTYFDDLNDKQSEFDTTNSQLVSKLAGLNARGVGGKTLYDLMYDQANTAFNRNTQLARADAAKKGVMRSGYMDRTAGGLASDYLGQQDQLIHQYGTDVNDQRSAAYATVQQQKDLERQLAATKANLARAAAARGQQNYMAQIGQAYTPYTPEATS